MSTFFLITENIWLSPGILVIIIIITLFQEGDIYITIVNHDDPRKERKLNQHYSNH